MCDNFERSRFLVGRVSRCSSAQMKMAAPVQRGRRERQPEVEVVERGSRESYKDVTRRSPWNSAIAMSALATRRTAGTKRKAMRSDGKESS